MFAAAPRARRAPAASASCVKLLRAVVLRVASLTSLRDTVRGFGEAMVRVRGALFFLVAMSVSSVLAVMSSCPRSASATAGRIDDALSEKSHGAHTCCRPNRESPVGDNPHHVHAFPD